MDLHTRATAMPGAGAARAVLVACACALLAALAIVLGADSAAGAERGGSPDAPLAAWTDAALTDVVARLEAEATRVGDELLDADARREEILRDRDLARDELGAFVAAAYRQGSSLDGSALTAVLSSRSITEAADRAHVAEIVGSHHEDLIGSLDEAEAQLDVSRLERAQMITRLGAVQARLVALRSEQERRAAIRAEHAAERARIAATKRERAAARNALATVPGTLVGSTASPAGSVSAAVIDGYLASKGSPMAGQGAAFVASGQRWGVDPRLLVAIAGAESNFGEITCGPNNAWGWACPNDPADFGTWAAGIDTVTQGLRRYYLDEGRTSVALIQQKYCPVGAANDPTGLNNHWLANVTKFLVEQGGNPAVVGPGPTAGALELPDFGLGLASAD